MNARFSKAQKEEFTTPEIPKIQKIKIEPTLPEGTLVMTPPQRQRSEDIRDHLYQEKKNRGGINQSVGCSPNSKTNRSYGRPACEMVVWLATSCTSASTSGNTRATH